MDSTYLSKQHQYDDMEQSISDEAELALQGALDDWRAKSDVKDILRKEAAKFLRDESYTGPLAGLLDRRDCLIESEAWIPAAFVFDESVVSKDSQGNPITCRENGLVYMFVCMSDVHAAYTAACVQNMTSGEPCSLWQMSLTVYRVAIESIVQQYENDPDIEISLMEAGL